MVYGILASGSCLLTDIVDQLHEPSKKVNSVERLTRHLNKGISAKFLDSYLSLVKTMVPKNPIIHIDDSDVVKPDGYKFGALGIVRDGSKSTNKKSVYEKGYHVTEACAITDSNHPVSIFSQIHSSQEKNYTSANTITFSAMERGAEMFKKATEQVRVLPISDKHLDYANSVVEKLRMAGVRVTLDSRAEKIGYKIREARLAKLPYMLIIGANEEETGTVSVRKRGEDGDLGSMPTDKFIADITEEIAKKVIS